MTHKDEALKMALAALGLVDDDIEWQERSITRKVVLKAITTIKQALAAQPAVPLTDEQIDALRNQYPPSAGIDFDVRCREFARAIEAAYGITKGQP